MRLGSGVATLMCGLLAAGCGGGSSGGDEDGGTPQQDGGGECVILPDRFDADTTLPKGCYLAQVTPVIAAGVTLTFDPGVKIIFSQDVGLHFAENDALVASGTAVDPILLTGAQPERGFWEGLIFDGVQSTANRLDYVTVEYAGSTTAANDPDAAAVKATSDSRGVHLAMTHTRLRASGGWGLWLSAYTVASSFIANELTGNTLGPANVDSDVAHILDTTSIFSGNDVDIVHVRTNPVSESVTWHAIDADYFLDGSLNVDKVWTLEPGVTLVMSFDSWIFVGGSDEAGMHAVGTAAAPITITGAEKTNGYWETIQIDNTNNAANVFDYVVVEYGGSVDNSADYAELMATSDSHGVTLSVTHSTFRHSPACGIYLGMYATGTIDDGTNTYEDTNGTSCYQN
jgi:hypothetical protein